MLDTALTKRSASLRVKITCKTLVSLGLIALAVALPQLVHLALGQPGGVQFLPMYLPALIGGCLLGARWAVAVGALSPVVSFLLTSLAGNPMPALPRLPFMIAELTVFALVAGLQSRVPRRCGAVPRRGALHRADDLVADSRRLAGLGDPGGAGAARHHRPACRAGEG